MKPRRLQQIMIPVMATLMVIVSIFSVSIFSVSIFSIGQAMAGEQAITVYKNPTWGCCAGWVGHLQENGFVVKSTDVSQAELVAVKNEHGVPRALHSCHTGVIEGYVIEGHVPAKVISRLLAERPDVAGLAVPGMPIGSPGMEGPHPKAYQVFSFDRDRRQQVYEQIRPNQ